MSRNLNLYVFGKHSILDGISNNVKFKEIYLSKDLSTKELKIFKDKKVVLISKKELDLLARGNHQGYVALIEIKIKTDIDSLIVRKTSRILVLDHIKDPQNFGALLRNANAFGFKEIIFPKENASPLSESVIRVSSGGYIGLNFYEVNSLIQTILKLKREGYWIYSTGFGKGAVELKRVPINKPAVLVLGSEKTGIRRSILKHSDEIITIEQVGSVSSLNVASAGAILLHWFNQKLCRYEVEDVR